MKLFAWCLKGWCDPEPTRLRREEMCVWRTLEASGVATVFGLCVRLTRLSRFGPLTPQDSPLGRTCRFATNGHMYGLTISAARD